MNTELIKLTKLRTNSENPRTISKEKYEKLINSILVFPKMLEIRPIVVDETFTALGGNQRTEALKDISKMEITTITERLVGLADFARMDDDERNALIQYWGEWLESKTVPVIKASQLTEDEKRQFIIKDNSSFGSYDWDMLANSWDTELLDDWGVDLPSDWNDSEEEKKEAQEDDFSEEDAANVETRVKVGEIWQLGEHRLMCGDSTKKEDVERLMGGEKADMNFMSPPYNIGKNAQLNDRDKDNKYLSYNDENDNYKDLLYKSTENSINNSKYSFINIQMLSGNKGVFCEYINEFKNNLCDISIWYKDNVAPAMARRVMNSAFEFVLIFGSQNVNRAIGTRDFRGDVSSVYQSHIQGNNEFSKVHSATFPIEFVSNYISNFTNEKEIISDLFGGTGTTLIACENLNRKARLMEIDAHYCDIIIARWEKLTGKEAVKIYG